MKQISFKEQNTVIAKNQPEYTPLPAYYGAEKEGEVISCWGLSLRERLTLLLTGRIWLRILTFNRPLQPQLLQIERPFVIKKSEENDD